jgi:hypothetical protein
MSWQPQQPPACSCLGAEDSEMSGIIQILAALTVVILAAINVGYPSGHQ